MKQTGNFNDNVHVNNEIMKVFYTVFDILQSNQSKFEILS